MPSRSDKIFQRGRSPKKYPRSRAAPSRRPLERVLIVCEGAKTEPQYFNKLLEYRGPSERVSIHVCGEDCGSDPVSVLDHAISISEQEGHYSEGGYGHIYCVVDGDNKERLRVFDSRVLGRSKRKKRAFKTLTPVKSVPCFEYWYLLHFNPYFSPILARQGRTAGDESCHILREISGMAGYKKVLNEEQIQLILNNTPIALKNAGQVARQAAAQGVTNPLTDVHFLVKRILDDDW